MDEASESDSRSPIACLAEGQLWVLRGDDKPQEQITSSFAASLKEKLLKMRKRNEWKEKGSSGTLFGSGELWGASTYDPSYMQVAITGVARGEGENVFYFVVQADDICGLFTYDLAESEEQRLHHGTDLIIHTIDSANDEGEMVCSISRDEGLHNLALFQPKKGGGFREITEGDSLDTYPRWVPGRRQVVYQTAGIGRSRDGDWVETAPCEIARLDFDDGEVTTLFANQSHDFLLPQMDANGNLYCIRRPYQPVRNHSFLNSLKDVALFPVRLVQGIFGFLNFFTSTFSGKPLSSAGGPRAATPNAKRLILYGNLVDAEKVAKEYSELADDDSRAAVPR